VERICKTGKTVFRNAAGGGVHVQGRQIIVTFSATDVRSWI